MPSPDSNTCTFHFIVFQTAAHFTIDESICINKNMTEVFSFPYILMAARKFEFYQKFCAKIYIHKQEKWNFIALWLRLVTFFEIIVDKQSSIGLNIHYFSSGDRRSKFVFFSLFIDISYCDVTWYDVTITNASAYKQPLIRLTDVE